MRLRRESCGWTNNWINIDEFLESPWHVCELIFTLGLTYTLVSIIKTENEKNEQKASPHRSEIDTLNKKPRLAT